ncbi:MAG: hypothetical protein K2Q18_04385 [Bdellovibrionales bacterium]|nr:hypothetical protein [Bdellovibrionales bacterium]
MKAIIISSLLFFSLRAMSAEYGESKKAPCTAIQQAQEKAASDSSGSSTKTPATKAAAK